MNKTTEFEKDIYDDVVEGIAMFGGILVGVVMRYATTVIVPTHDTITKMILRESGSIAISTAAMNMTMSSVKYIGRYLKPKIVKK